MLHGKQLSNVDESLLLANNAFNTYHASDDCTTATTTTVTSITSTVTSTSQTVTSTTATQTSTTVRCDYDGPIVGQKGRNTFRIDILTPVSLNQCLAGCTANVDCNGVSYDVCDNFSFSLVVMQPFSRTLLLINCKRIQLYQQF
jgi:hypothetical protein